MKKHLLLQRKAIAMLELIFAIVIMGIVLLSIPNLISISSSSGYISLQQEAIATASSQMNLIMSKQWDENNANGEDPILSTNSGTPGLAVPRSGVNLRSNTTSAGTTLSASTVFKDTNDTFDDIDDANDLNMTLRDFSTTSVESGDNIDTQITIATTVRYVSDAPSTANTYTGNNTIQYNIDPNTIATAVGSTNIKLISTRLQTNNPLSELQKNIVLHAFSCNIGTYDPYHPSSVKGL